MDFDLLGDLQVQGCSEATRHMALS